MITFVVTTYNLEARLLRRCLESIVSQGLRREAYEIIVVDDESDVSPQGVVDEFLSRADIRLYVQKHSRQGAARNLALRHARGEWVQFVDGDDYLFAHAVEGCLGLAEEHGLDLLMFGFREVGDEEVSVSCPPNVPDDGLRVVTGNEYMSRNNLFGACWPLLFRRELLDASAYGEPLRFTENIYIEDEEFVTLLVWRAQRMARVDCPVYAYYQRPGSTVHSRSREHTDELFRNYFVVMHRLVNYRNSMHDRPAEGLTRKMHTLATDILRRALREEDWRERWYQSARALLGLGLYPVADGGYSMKYNLFRLLSRCKLGRMILRIYEKRLA